MSFTREELREKIDQLSLFEKKKVKVNMSDDEYVQDDEHVAICAVGTAKPEVYASKGYELIQFVDIFKPIIDSVPGDLHGYLASYGGYAQLIIFPEDNRLKDETGQFGLVAINSVNCSSAVIVKFCVETPTMRITLPAKIAGLKKHHTKNVGNVVQDYISMVGSVKQVWRKIALEFPKYKIVTADTGEENTLELKPVLEQLELGERLSKTVEKRYEDVTLDGNTFTLWDIFVTVVERINESEYKSDVHKEKRMDKISNAIFNYATILSL